MENVVCNLCGSSDERPVYTMPDTLFFPDESFQIVECVQCGLGFVNPRPDRVEMQRYYPSEFYAGFNEDALHHEARYAIEASIVEEGGIPRGRLLDLGCAHGGFPRFMKKRGWDVTGVEVSMNTDQDPGFPVHRCEFTDVPISAPAFDVITAWAVLEHVHDPAAYFHKAAELLLPGGRFVFLVTNFESDSSRFLYREDPPRHLYFFTEATVRRYLDNAGLVLEKAEYSGRVFEMRAVNWLVAKLRRMLGMPFSWADASLTRQSWMERRRIESLAFGTVAYALTHPLRMLDRLTMRAYERYQQLTGSYGIVTFRASKPR